MSRIGSKPVAIPEGVTVGITESEIQVKGKDATLTIPRLDGIKIEEKDKEKIKKQIKFIKKLESFGFITKIKPLKIMPDGKKKSDCDINIVVEGMDNLTRFDRLILLSGDGDFMPFLRILKREKKKIQVLSFNKGTAREIKKLVGGDWHNLEEDSYRKHLKRG